MTNATKALIISALNAGIGLVVAFGVVLTPAQIGAILTFANAAGALVVALTYKNSAKRIPDGGEQRPIIQNFR
jgi:hypothetical protein